MLLFQWLKELTDELKAAKTVRGGKLCRLRGVADRAAKVAMARNLQHSAIEEKRRGTDRKMTHHKNFREESQAANVPATPWKDRYRESEAGRFALRSLVLAVCTTAVTAAITATGAKAQEATHPHGDIFAAIEGAALNAAANAGFENVEVRVRPIDQRLRPNMCTQPLEIVRPHNGSPLGAVSYGVRCPDETPWTLYLRADVSSAMEIPVINAALPRGALISLDDLTMQQRRITRTAADLIVDPKVAVGMELKRPLPAGSTLHHAQLTRPRIVTRGQMVTLVAGGTGFEVRMQGKAMGSGAAGDRLLVTNSRSGRRIEGIVLSDGSIRIP